MSNTTSSMTPSYTSFSSMSHQSVWIVSQTLNSVLLIVDIWLIIAVGRYGFRSGKFSRDKLSDYSGGLVLMMAFVATLMLFPRLLITQIATSFGFNNGTSVSDHHCEIAQDIATVIYGFDFLTVYVFLWLRQHSLYQQPSIKRLQNTVIKILGWGSMVFLVCAGIAIMIIFVLPNSYFSSKQGCIFKGMKDENAIGHYVIPVVLVCGQLTLLGLFIYPLNQHRNVPAIAASMRKTSSQIQLSSLAINNVTDNAIRKMSVATTVGDDGLSESSQSKVDKATSSTPTHQPQGKLRQKWSSENVSQFKTKSSLGRVKSSARATAAKRVQRVMRRSVVCAIICIVCDLTAIILSQYVLPFGTPVSISNTIFNIALIINISTLVVSFEHYKYILFGQYTNGKKWSSPDAPTAS